MARSHTVHDVARQTLLIGVMLMTGCAQSRSSLQETLARRIMPGEIATSQPTIRAEGKGDRATTDAKVKPAAVQQPGQGSDGRSEGDRSNPLPLAIGEPAVLDGHAAPERGPEL